MTVRARLSASLLALATAVSLLAVGPTARADVVAATSSPSVVRVPIVTMSAPDSRGANGIVEIRLGREAPIRVMLDTGSVGLRVFPGGWDGAVADGMASAEFAIGGVRSSGPVTFQYVSTTNGYFQQWAARGVVGILGIGMGRSPVPNPLTLLPGDLGRRWSVHFARSDADGSRTGRLLLGAAVPADADATFRVPPEGTSSTGAPAWDDHRAQACWSFDGRRVCADTWFDSGFHPSRFAGQDFSVVPTSSASGRVTPGVVVRMGAVGAAFTTWGFVAGRQPSRNLAVVMSTKGPARVNTGNAVFFDHTITYDLRQGLVAVS